MGNKKSFKAKSYMKFQKPGVINDSMCLKVKFGMFMVTCVLLATGCEREWRGLDVGRCGRLLASSCKLLKRRFHIRHSRNSQMVLIKGILCSDLPF